MNETVSKQKNYLINVKCQFVSTDSVAVIIKLMKIQSLFAGICTLLFNFYLHYQIVNLIFHKSPLRTFNEIDKVCLKTMFEN